MADYLCFLCQEALFESKARSFTYVVAAKGIAPSRSPLPCSPILLFVVANSKIETPFSANEPLCWSDRDVISVCAAFGLSYIQLCVRRIDRCAYLYCGL